MADRTPFQHQVVDFALDQLMTDRETSLTTADHDNGAVHAFQRFELFGHVHQ